MPPRGRKRKLEDPEAQKQALKWVHSAETKPEVKEEKIKVNGPRVIPE
jgi:hypothetical protein